MSINFFFFLPNFPFFYFVIVGGGEGGRAISVDPINIHPGIMRFMTYEDTKLHHGSVSLSD